MAPLAEAPARGRQMAAAPGRRAAVRTHVASGLEVAAFDSVVVVRCVAEAGAAWGRSAKGRRLWSGESGVVHHIEDACSDTPLWSTAYA